MADSPRSSSEMIAGLEETGVTKAQIGNREDDYPGPIDSGPSLSEISDKLDRVLARLDDIEAQLRSKA